MLASCCKVHKLINYTKIRTPTIKKTICVLYLPRKTDCMNVTCALIEGLKQRQVRNSNCLNKHVCAVNLKSDSFLPFEWQLHWEKKKTRHFCSAHIIIHGEHWWQWLSLLFATILIMQIYVKSTSRDKFIGAKMIWKKTR
jgi:hypothetical protein